ncbi:MAG: hypothetical protein S4CHLAM6_08640 [Chlamydiae bacterium]|nr:hypothetical protein [Chlamydiota bacterium]
MKVSTLIIPSIPPAHTDIDGDKAESKGDHKEQLGLDKSTLIRRFLQLSFLIVSGSIYFSGSYRSLKEQAWGALVSKNTRLLSCANTYSFKGVYENAFGIEKCIAVAKQQTADAFMSCIGIKEASQAYREMRKTMAKIHPDKNNHISDHERLKFQEMFEYFKGHKKNSRRLEADIRDCESKKEEAAERAVREWADKQHYRYGYDIKKLGKKEFLYTRYRPFFEKTVCSEINNDCFSIRARFEDARTYKFENDFLHSFESNRFH